MGNEILATLHVLILLDKHSNTLVNERATSDTNVFHMSKPTVSILRYDHQHTTSQSITTHHKPAPPQADSHHLKHKQHPHHAPHLLNLSTISTTASTSTTPRSAPPQQGQHPPPSRSSKPNKSTLQAIFFADAQLWMCKCTSVCVLAQPRAHVNWA